MELRHLRYFVAVAEAGNISHAAERLHISQPPLSRQIRDLEHELGLALFERTSRAVHLTAAGKEFLPEARAVLKRAASAIESVRQFQARLPKTLAIGYAPSPTVEILPPALRAFQAAHPNVKVALHDLTSAEMLAGVREQSLDLAVMVRQAKSASRGLTFAPLKRYLAGILLPPGHPLEAFPHVTAAQILREPLVAYNLNDYSEYPEWLEQILRTKASKLKIAEECDGALSLISAVEAGRGIAVVMESVQCISGNRVSFRPIINAPESPEVGVMYRTKGMSSEAQQLLQTLRHSAMKLVARRRKPPSA
jgi:DNA-binding transcriptional LysR family regulator